MLLTVTENGYGKRTKISDYRLINRGGKGVINIITSERNGNVVSVLSIEGKEEIMTITRRGIAIRTNSSGISIIGRNTQGVRVMKLREGDKVVAATKIKTEDEEPEEV
jgi:DNA gyrase subunit A